MSKRAKIVIAVLFVLVFVSLGLNIYLLMQLQEMRLQTRLLARNFGPPLQESVAQAILDLETFEESIIQFDLEIDQDLPIRVAIPIHEEMELPIQMTVPISQEINTTIMLDPLQMGMEIPTDVSVPVNVAVPIDTTVPVAVEQTIPISTVVPLDLTVPIAIEVSETDLPQYTEQFRSGLEMIEILLKQILLDIEEQ